MLIDLFILFFEKSHLPTRCVREFRAVCFHSHLLDCTYQYFRWEKCSSTRNFFWNFGWQL